MHVVGPTPKEQRETTIKDAIATVNQQLGPAASARLQAYIQTHVTAHKLHVRTHKPHDLPSAPYRLTPRRDMGVEQ